VSTGEQISSALLSMQLQTLGLKARSLNAHQLSIETDSHFRRARIKNLDAALLKELVAKQTIPVITGFQGVAEDGSITTLGRGGSDTTALVVASKIGADECLMYTDVDGIYTADPSLVVTARKLPGISYEAMLELSSVGSRVLHIQAVECAKKYNIPLRVLSSFDLALDQHDFSSMGTLISHKDELPEKDMICGIAFDSNQAKLCILGVDRQSDLIDLLLRNLLALGIHIDLLIQAPTNADTSFTVHRDDYREALLVAKDLAARFSASSVEGDSGVAKVSLVGLGISVDTSAKTMMFETLHKEGIAVQLTATSDIKISVVLNVQSLHTAFALQKQPLPALSTAKN
jgi:aspartate kinase